MIKTCLHNRRDSNDSALDIKEKDPQQNHSSCANNSTRDSHQADDRTIFEENNEHKFYLASCLNFFDDVYSKYSASVLLQNKGNTARDHLANERTFLAWFRTSLSLVTLGIGIIQIYHMSGAKHKRLGRALGLIFVMASILFLYFGVVRYFHAQWALQHGNFPASRGIITWASFCILFLFVGMFTVLILESKNI